MAKTIDIQTTKTFQNILNCKSRVQHHLGGSRSGKTFAILQYLLVKAIERPSVNITIIRKSGPVLKRTTMKDFIDILKSLDIYNEDDFNITDRVWSYGDSQIQFVSTDDPDKLRGLKQDILFIDEASEVDQESYFQAQIRTSEQIILAYNPTVSPYHWLRQMYGDNDVQTYITNYLDNPYLPKEQIRAIEDLKEKNPKKWLIYGKGEYAPNEKAVFDFEVIDGIGSDVQHIGFGIDFGYAQDPTALVAVYRRDGDLILEELIYERGLVTSDIVEKLRELDITKSEEIWADSAEPRLIEEIYRSGFNIKPVTKGKDSINFGINVMKNYRIRLLKSSQNLINEMYGYQWSTDKYGYVLDKPEGGLDHLIDAARYCCMMKLSEKAKNKGTYSITIH